MDLANEEGAATTGNNATAAGLKKRTRGEDLDDCQADRKNAAIKKTASKITVLDDGILEMIVRYATGNSRDVKSIRAVSKRFNTLVDGSLHWISWDWMYRNDHWHLIGTECVKNNLEALQYYEACVDAGVFEKKPTRNRTKETLIPKSVSRILLMEELLQDFPSLKAQYESLSTPQLMDDDAMIFAPIEKYLIMHGILPDPNLVDWDEHCNINLYPGRRKYRSHTIYNEYTANVAANIHQPGILPELRRHCLSHLPARLIFLIAAGNKGMRW